MTIKDLHINFYLELDKTADFEYPSFQPEQIDYWLNKAQDFFIEDRLYPKDKEFGGFEVSQKRIDDLKDLVKSSGIITPVSADATTYKTKLPNDYRHLTRHRCITNDTNCGLREVSGIQIRTNSINTRLKDPFWKPTSEEPLYYIEGEDIVYEKVSGFTITGTKISYIKKPTLMRLGSEYSNPTTDVESDFKEDYVLRNILNIAVSMVLENIESQRYQTNLNELSKNG